MIQAPVRNVWALFAAVGLAIFVTYWRLPPEQLYNVSDEGLELAAGRLLVFLNYPTSLAAIPIAWLSAERIRTRTAMWAAAVATVLCAVTAWPGVVDQDRDISGERVERARVDDLAVAVQGRPGDHGLTPAPVSGLDGGM